MVEGRQEEEGEEEGENWGDTLYEKGRSLPRESRNCNM